LPALFFVMLVSIPFAWFLLLPRDMKDFSQSLFTVSIFASNILFWIEAGYFGVENEFKPLLHTWSLAVEEQYYVLFPLLLTLTWKLRRRWILGVLVSIGIVSLVIAEWSTRQHPTAGFFLLPFRAWELMIGAVTAFYILHKENQASSLNENFIFNQILSVTGLAMVIFAVFTFDRSTPFPGMYALIPTIGSALIILFAVPGTLTARVLGSKPLVGIGLISYSAYLWHQPIFAFVRHQHELVSSDLYFVFSLIPIFLGYLSWRYIEKPFRNKNRIGRTTLFTCSLIGTLFFLIVGLTGHLTQGFDGRFSDTPELVDIDNRLRGNHGLSKNCNKLEISAECQTSKNPTVLVWGDSYAMHLVSGLIASNPSIKLIQRTRSVCAPFQNLAPIVPPMYTRQWAEDCISFNHNVIEWLQNQNSVEYVIISSRYAQYLENNNKLLLGSEIVESEVDIVSDELIKLLTTLMEMGIRPVIFSPTPSNGNDIGRCLKRATFSKVSLTMCDFPEQEMTDLRIQSYGLLEKIENSGFKVIWLNKLMCEGGRCKTSNDSILIYRDSGHLSYEGSDVAGKLFKFYDLLTEN